jgi:hypothetical protein
VNRRRLFIKTAIVSKKQDVAAFIQELQRILSREGFSPDYLFLNMKSKPGEEYQYSTEYTIVDLDYAEDDVIERLKELRLEEYSETLFDRDNDRPPLLYVFGKVINGKTVYIKVKTRDEDQVICVSFHYAKEQMEYPYK